MSDIIISPNGVTIRELAGRSGSDSADNNTGERSWLIRGTTDPIVARATLVTYAGNVGLYSYDGLGLKSMSWSPYPDGGEAAWTFVATYDFTPEPGEFTISIDTSGATVNVQQAFSQVRFDAPGETGPDYKQSINVDSDGNPRGVDKIIPSLKVNVRARIAERFVLDALAYARTIASYTGKVNSTTYLGFAPGELLFKGASGDVVTENNPVLSFAFEASPNATGLTIGNISGISKQGWDFIWFDWVQKNDPAAGLKTTTARSAYVATIYEKTDFAGLQIGVA